MALLVGALFASTGGATGATPKHGHQGDREPADADDTYCIKAGKSPLVKINGCLGDNNGFDGYSYRPLWPDGNTTLRPTPFQLSSPLTGGRC